MELKVHWITWLYFVSLKLKDSFLKKKVLLLKVKNHKHSYLNQVKKLSNKILVTG